MTDSPTNSDIMRAIGTLEGTIAGIASRLDDHRDRMDSHSTRIDNNVKETGAVKNRQMWLSGAAAAIGGVIGLLSKKIGLN